MINKVMNLYFKGMTYNYVTFIIGGLLLFPFVFLFNGLNGVIECYITKQDLSYTTYKDVRRKFWKDK